MIIYNVTVSVDHDIHEEWLEWMKEVHIPDVMATGLFKENRILRVLTGEHSETTFSVQYDCESMEHLEKYQELHAPGLQKEHTDRYGEKCIAFRTLLEVVH